MHPLKFFLSEIYEDYWGIPDDRKQQNRRRSRPGLWLRSRPARHDKAGW